MTALIYRPERRWPIWIAFAGAALVHLAAVAIARNQPQASTLPMVDSGSDIVVAFTPPDPAPVDPVETPPLPLPPMVNENDFAEAIVIPPPIRKINQKPLQPLIRSKDTTTVRSVRALALSAPRPEYPYEARRQHTTGSGVALLTVDPATGNVLDLAMAQSTGSPVLDNATMTAFRRWRFPPGTAGKVQLPITYTLTGASY